MFKKIFLIFTAITLFNGFLFAEDKEEKFNVGKVVMHHVLESHDWEITEYPVGDGKYEKLAFRLPWILYSSANGLEFFSSTESLLASGKYIELHGVVYVNNGSAPAHQEGEEHKQPISEPTPPADTAHKAEQTHGEGEHTKVEKPASEHEGAQHGTVAIDFSPSKTVLHMFLVAIALILIFSRVKKGYETNRGKAPSGIQSFFEPIIIFIKDLAKENLKEKHERFLPYLLTVFFFIWFSNLFGLTPFSSNIAGNISVTVALALLSFIIINVNGTKDYWKHIFAMPGVPKPLLLILTPVEVLGVFIKPIALAIRLFANIAAGHFMVLSLICLIFIFGKVGESVGGSILGAILGSAFSIFIMCIEMLVAILQAYVFTLLTTVFLGMAVESHDEHAHH